MEGGGATQIPSPSTMEIGQAAYVEARSIRKDDKGMFHLKAYCHISLEPTKFFSVAVTRSSECLWSAKVYAEDLGNLPSRAKIKKWLPLAGAHKE